MSERIKGSNSHGFENEECIVKELNNKKLKNLNTNLKRFIKDICNENDIQVSDDMCIGARIEKDNRLKQDFYITLDGNEFGISMKMGTGNSVHQERIEDFIKWISEISDEPMNDEIKNALRLFIWADGSYDGKAPISFDDEGNIIGRFGAKEFKELHPHEREIIQKFFKENEKDIINRAIFEGKNNSKVDYVYHGTPQSGTWLSKDEIIDFNKKTSKGNAVISVGNLSVQAWNVCLKNDNPKKRGQIQLKYSSIEKDFDTLMRMKTSNLGTFEGDKEEFNIAKEMNKNKKNKFWDILSEKCKLDADRSKYFVVKVEGNKKSFLAEKNVKCKSDNFIIEANIEPNYLLQCQYQLTEDMLKDIGDYKIIEGSGISVKRADSKKYTIVKLTEQTFKKAFSAYTDNIDYLMAGLMVYSNKEEKIPLNSKILEDLNITEDDLKEFYSKEYRIEGEGILDKEFLHKIKEKAKGTIKDIIEDNSELKESLFTGKGWFEEPYYASFIFKNADLTDDIYSDYKISNGSGRSEGTYTIILKPQ